MDVRSGIVALTGNGSFNVTGWDYGVYVSGGKATVTNATATKSDSISVYVTGLGSSVTVSSTAQAVTLTFPANTSIETNKIYTIKASLDGGAKRRDRHTSCRGLQDCRSNLYSSISRQLNPAAGTGVISGQIENILKRELGITVLRLSGGDRYLTCLAIAKYFEGYSKSSPGKEYKNAALATGEDFPDALVGASLAARGKYPILLVRKDKVSPEVADYLRNINLEKLYIYGGRGVIADVTKDELSLGK